MNRSYNERFARQLVMPEIGEAGQEKLKNARVLVIGAGGLGSAAIYYLAAAGIGTLGIMDGDLVELTNLNRQIIHSEKRLGMNKALSAGMTVTELNSEINVKAYDHFADANNILGIIKDYDFIIDASDRAVNKFLINDACVIGKKPFCHGGVLRWGGQIMTYIPGKGPCLRCIFGDVSDDDAPPCSEVGIIGMTCGTAGSVQAFEAVKYILGAGELLCGRILVFDGFSMSFRSVSFPSRNEKCRVCSEKCGHQGALLV